MNQNGKETVEERLTFAEKVEESWRLVLSGHLGLIKNLEAEVANLNSKLADLKRQLDAAPAELKKATASVQKYRHALAVANQRLGKPLSHRDGVAKVDVTGMSPAQAKAARLRARLKELDAQIDLLGEGE